MFVYVLKKLSKYHPPSSPDESCFNHIKPAYFALGDTATICFSCYLLADYS